MNDHLPTRSAPQVPWGGVGGSGLGRARGAIALRTCAEPKVVTWDPPVGHPAWWFPYDGALARAARGVAGLRSARDADRERAWREDALPIARVTGRWLRGLRARALRRCGRGQAAAARRALRHVAHALRQQRHDDPLEVLGAAAAGQRPRRVPREPVLAAHAGRQQPDGHEVRELHERAAGAPGPAGA